MKSAKQFSLIIVSLIALISCEKDEDTNSVIDQIYPTAEGNKWVYDYTSATEMAQETIEIGEFTKIDEHSGFLMNSSAVKSLIKSDDNGNLVFIGSYTDSESYFPESIFFKKDVEVGEKYDSKTVVFSNETDDKTNLSLETREIECVGKNELVETPAGNFQCTVYQYSPDGGSAVFKHYLALNIGTIKIEKLEEGNLYSTSVLKSYELH